MGFLRHRRNTSSNFSHHSLCNQVGEVQENCAKPIGYLLNSAERIDPHPQTRMDATIIDHISNHIKSIPCLVNNIIQKTLALLTYF